MKIQRTLDSIAPQRLQHLQDAVKTRDTKDASQLSFTDTLKESIEEVNRLQKKADHAIDAFSTGETQGIAQTMIAVEKANISFQLMTQVRNRILEAYQEVMRMQS